MDERLFDLDFVNAKVYYYEHIDDFRKWVSSRRRERRKTDPQFKFICNMRSRLTIAFKNRNWTKDSKTRDILGGSVEEVMTYIEAKFKDGMSWENYGKWHVDHIIPLCSAKTPEEVAKLCHFSNLQPLWRLENIRKRGKLEISI